MVHTRAMRLIALSTFFSLIWFSGAFAQQRFTAGPRLGLNMSSYWNNNTYMSYTPGVAAGVFLMYSSLNHFGISGDLLYSQRGTNYNDGHIKFTQHVNYLEIPVVARYFLTLSGNFRPNVFVGPSLGIKLNAKRTNGEVLSGSSPGVINTDNSSDFNNLDLGATGGIQLNWGLGHRQHFLIDARYTLGLTDVQTNLPNLWVNRGPLSNSTATITLGYGFGVGPEYRSRYRR